MNTENDYWTRIAPIADDMRAAMRDRMGNNGDWRPLYVYVSNVDGGHTIGHEGQHKGYWRMERPVTASMEYARVSQHLARELRNAPLYAGGAA